MRILASVYACSPFDGSERAVGWNWIKELDKRHKVFALTSVSMKHDIQAYLKTHPNELSNTQFIYVLVPKLLSFWHKGFRGERVYTGGPKINTTSETAIKVDPAPYSEMVETMAKKMIELASDPLRRKRMGIAGREYALKNFTLESKSKQIETIYAEVSRVSSSYNEGVKI